MGGSIRRLRLKIYGRVQGVFYRGMGAEEARRLGLTGLVRNCADGCVEVVAEGDEASLKKLRDWCKVGPPYAKVERVEEEWKETGEREFDDFKIIF